MEEKQLSDLGERRIIAEVVREFVGEVDNDCAEVLLPRDCVAVATADPVPPPACAQLGLSEDDFYTGWLLVTINMSDLASDGARPSSFFASLDLPATWTVGRLRRLLLGVREACDLHGARFAGGNIRDSTKFAGHGFAVGGTVAPTGRSGATPGDRVVVVGPMGRFWHDVARASDGATLAPSSPVFRPRAQVAFMAEAVERGLVAAAMDNSDGLIPSLRELARASEARVVVDSSYVHECSFGSFGQALGWGDWNVVCACSPASTLELRRLAQQRGVPVSEIGEFRQGQVACVFEVSGREVSPPRFESERFAADSWFVGGIDGYRARIEAADPEQWEAVS